MTRDEVHPFNFREQGEWEVSIEEVIMMMTKIILMFPEPTSQSDIDERVPRFIQVLALVRVKASGGTVAYHPPHDVPAMGRSSVVLDGWHFSWMQKS